MGQNDALLAKNSAYWVKKIFYILNYTLMEGVAWSV